jgi:hypothetical protein
MKRSHLVAVLCAAASTLSTASTSSTAFAEPLRARDTADVGMKGDWSIGIFDPLKIAVHDGIELKGPSLLFLIEPNLTVRVAHFDLFGFRFAGEYGVSTPSPLMNLLQGYVTPTYAKGGGKVGWFLVPSVGLVATRGNRASRTLTFSADVAVGIPLTRDTTTAPNGVAPYDDLLSPIYGRVRVRLQASYDAGLCLDWLRGRIWTAVSLHGTTYDSPSPIAINAGLNFDVAVGKQSRVTLGVMWWNADTQEMDMKTHAHVRSNDFFPTIDFIWAGY